MSVGINFEKVLNGDFDRIVVESRDTSDWLSLTMTIGHTDMRVIMELRSTEAVRDLHYALGRYLALFDARK